MWSDLKSITKSKTGESPLNSIDIIDGDDYDRFEDVDRLQSARQHPELKQLVLSEIEMEQPVIDALMDLLRSAQQPWDAIYLELVNPIFTNIKNKFLNTAIIKI